MYVHCYIVSWQVFGLFIVIPCRLYTLLNIDALQVVPCPDRCLWRVPVSRLCCLLVWKFTAILWVHRYMKGQIRSLECVSSVFRKAAVCPACPKASILCECMSYHKVIVSLINRMVESSQSHWMPCLDCAVRKQQVAASVVHWMQVSSLMTSLKSTHSLTTTNQKKMLQKRCDFNYHANQG